ncbi:MAG: Dimethylglycine dehydrogenase [Arenicellales bacterium IbO2]|nr:MAG: Dimethylglycine dehydrogenase [Arenicellales bacterium IbO2]
MPDSLPSHARVVIIGGGVVGCSILFHLARKGWKDVVLLERAELTSGSSWHAAGQIHTISSDPNISKLQGYTINLYPELEKLSGQSVGHHQTGGFYLASSPARLDYLKQERSKARYLGLDQEFVSLEEVARMHPLIEPKHYLGALYDPLDGHIDPSGVTYAYAKAAKVLGASWHCNTPVTATAQRADGSWEVRTPRGEVHAEMLVNAAGLWAREVGHLSGVNLPVQPMEHHYLITETIPEVQAAGRELPCGIDYESNLYFRQEHQGLLLGTYEPKATPWMLGGTPQDFGHELLESDLARVSERLEIAFARIPALGRAGIKNVVNGPFSFGPDGNPMIGPVPGMRNYWAAVGVMAGFCQAGGVGLCIAEWMAEGEPAVDVWAMDIARFGEFATHEYGAVKAAENYTRRFLISYPNEELPRGRRRKTTALYDRLLARGAVMGASFGLEHALWFSDSKENAHETPTLRRSNAFPFVSEEVRAVRERIGAVEIANFAQHEFRGRGARAFLDKLLAAKLPQPGRLALTPMLRASGRLCGDLSVACLDEESFLLIGSGAAQEMHRRWFELRLREHENENKNGGEVRYRNASDDYHGIAIAGPQARELLSRITRGDAGAALRFRDVRRIAAGGVPALLARVSFSGELGYEIYCAPPYQLKLFEEIENAGEDIGLRWYGARALMSLRLEKNWGVWSLDYRPDCTAAEAGLDAFMDFGKGDFIGREAALSEKDNKQKKGGGARAKKLAAMVVETEDIDASGDEAIFHNGECVGYVTSGGYAHHCKKSVALGYVPAELAKDGARFAVEMLGEQHPAQLIARPLYDPAGKKMRA